MPTDTKTNAGTVLADLVRSALRSAQERGHQMVTSSNGRDQYRVTFSDRRPVACTCRGFTYRGHCRHLDEMRAVVEMAAAVGY